MTRAPSGWSPLVGGPTSNLLYEPGPVDRRAWKVRRYYASFQLIQAQSWKKPPAEWWRKSFGVASRRALYIRGSASSVHQPGRGRPSAWWPFYNPAAANCEAMDQRKGRQRIRCDRPLDHGPVPSPSPLPNACGSPSAPCAWPTTSRQRFMRTLAMPAQRAAGAVVP